MKKVLHLFSNDNNFGDSGSAAGIEFLFNKFGGNKFNFENYFIANNDLTPEIIRRINTEKDFVIVGGGGLFRKPKFFKLIFSLSESSLKKIKKPIIIYGVGVNYENGRDKELSDIKKQLFKLKKYVSLFYVRDLYTQNILNELQIENKLAPCPSLFLEPAEIKILSGSNKKRVGIILAPFTRVKTKVFNSYVETLVSFLAAFKNEYDFYLINHCRVVDRSYLKLFKILDIPLLYSADHHQLMARYCAMDYVIGSRGHMPIFATGANKPFLNISYNVKCDAFVNLLGYPADLNFDIKSLKAEKMKEKFKNMLSIEDELKSVLFSKKEEFFQYNKQVVNEILCKAR